MQPVKHDGLDVVYDNGVPVTLSRSRQSDVIVAPVTGPTGRYKIGNQVAFLVLVRNRSPERIEVSEASFSLTANGTRARTITAAAMEDAIRSDAAWAQAATGFSAVVSSLGAAQSAGRSTAVVQSGGKTAYVDVRDHAEAQRAQREVARDYAQASAAIATREQYALANLTRMVQRNTVQPNSEVGGFVVMDVPRAACVKVIQLGFEAPASQETVSQGKMSSEARMASAAAGAMTRTEVTPCHFTFTAEVGGETHTISFDELFSGTPTSDAKSADLDAPSRRTL
jgi:hypothetical protein